MKKRVLTAIIFFVSVFLPAFVKADEKYSLKEIIELALKNNHYVRAKHFGVLSADKDLSSSYSSFYPKLTLEEKFTTGDQTSYAVFTKLNQGTLSAASFLNPGSATNFQTTFTVEMPVYVKELHLVKDTKKLSLFSVTKDFERFQEEIAFRVFQSYLNVNKAKAYRDIALKSVDEAKEVYRIAKLRAETGTGLKSDELRALVFLKERESMLIKAENEVNIARTALGLLVSQDSFIDTSNSEVIELKLPDFEQLKTVIYESRKDYIAKTFDVENANKYYELEKARFYPKLYLSGSYFNDGRNLPLGSDGSGYVVGLAMRWELFDRKRGDDEAKMRYEALKAKEFLKQFEKEMVFNLKVSYLRVDEAKKRLDVAKEAVAQAEETFRLIKLRYDNNLSTIVELLDAELSLVTARNNVVLAENEYMEAVGKTLYEAGVFLKSVKD